jgi:hypothetical protein
MITEQYVTFETAKTAKGKGFNENTDSYYLTVDGATRLHHIWDKNCSVKFPANNEKLTEITELSGYNNYISAPTQSLLAGWLREIRNVNVTVRFRKDICKYFYEVENIQISEDGFVSGKKQFSRYEHAMEEGLRCALNFLAW